MNAGFGEGCAPCPPSQANRNQAGGRPASSGTPDAAMPLSAGDGSTQVISEEATTTEGVNLDPAFPDWRSWIRSANLWTLLLEALILLLFVLASTSLLER